MNWSPNILLSDNVWVFSQHTSHFCSLGFAENRTSLTLLVSFRVKKIKHSPSPDSAQLALCSDITLHLIYSNYNYTMVMVEKAIMRSAVTEETNTAATQRPAELGDVHNTKHNSQQQGGRILRRANYQAHILHNSFYREQMHHRQGLNERTPTVHSWRCHNISHICKQTD